MILNLSPKTSISQKTNSERRCRCGSDTFQSFELRLNGSYEHLFQIFFIIRIIIVANRVYLLIRPASEFRTYPKVWNRGFILSLCQIQKLHSLGQVSQCRNEFVGLFLCKKVFILLNSRFFLVFGGISAILCL